MWFSAGLDVGDVLLLSQGGVLRDQEQVQHAGDAVFLGEGGEQTCCG